MYLDETDTLAGMKIAECDSNRKYHISLTASILQIRTFCCKFNRRNNMPDASYKAGRSHASELAN